MRNPRRTMDGIRKSVKGKAIKAIGSAKDTVGELSGNDRLRVEGKVEKVKGTLLDTMGKVERAIARKV